MRNRLHLIVLCLVIICTTSCKKIKILKAPGSVEQEIFNVTFPFELIQDVIIIEVNLKGETHKFILDTGGFNLIGKQLAEHIGIKGVTKIEVDDSQGNKQKIPILELDALEIAGINFQKTGTGIVDFKELNAISCLDLKGMIGANLMQNAVWKIDYQRQEITIANSITAFDIPANNYAIPFTTSTFKSPNIEITVDGIVEKEVEIDLGSTGDFKLAQSTFDKLTTTKKTSGTGLFSAGLYGYGLSEKVNFARVNQISLGDLKLTDQLANFKSGRTSTIGNKFLKNYQVILNWFDNELILIPVIEPIPNLLDHYGFEPIFRGNQPQVGFIYDNSSADKVGLKITDKIIELAGRNTENISKDEWCELKNTFSALTIENIQIKVERAGETLSFELVLAKLL